MNIKLRKQCLGMGLIGWIVVIPLVLILLLILIVGFYEGRKAYWDYRVTKMCEKDGGMIIYENIELTEEELNLYKDKFGKYGFPRENQASEFIQIVSKDKSTYIRRNYPEVRRNELSIIRRTDEKILGMRVSYSRVGGELFVFHPSIFRCPETLENTFSAIVQLDRRVKL